MDIQPLSNSAFAAAAMQRPQNAAPDASGLSTQATSTLTQNQQTKTTPVAHGDSVTREQLDAAVKATKDFVGTINSSLEFSVDDDTGTSVVKIIDKETKELIRQIPSQEMLSIAKALDTIKGLLVRQKA